MLKILKLLEIDSNGKCGMLEVKMSSVSFFFYFVLLTRIQGSLHVSRDTYMPIHREGEAIY